MAPISLRCAIPMACGPGCACIRMGTFNPCRLCSNSWPGRIRTRPWRWNSLPPWKCGTCAPSARRAGRRFWGKPGIHCFSASTACTFPIGICCSASMACPLPGPRRALSERTGSGAPGCASRWGKRPGSSWCGRAIIRSTWAMPSTGPGASGPIPSPSPAGARGKRTTAALRRRIWKRTASPWPR